MNHSQNAQNEVISRQPIFNNTIIPAETPKLQILFRHSSESTASRPDVVRRNCQSTLGQYSLNNSLFEIKRHRNGKQVGKAEKDANFTWPDEETALLIQVVIDY